MSSSAVARLVSSAPGRTRLRFDAQRGDASFFDALAEALVSLDGVQSVQTRALTGSVLVTYAGAWDGVASAAGEEGLFALAPEGAAPLARAREVQPAAVAGALFGALGVYQLFANRVLPPALTLFWYAATLAKAVPGPAHAVEAELEDAGDGD
jgi:hypothetical protein